MNCSTPGLPVHHQPLEFTQTHVHWVGDAIQPSHPVVPFSSCLQSFPASRSFSRSQFFASCGQSIGVSALASVLPKNTRDWSNYMPIKKEEINEWVEQWEFLHRLRTWEPHTWKDQASSLSGWEHCGKFLHWCLSWSVMCRGWKEELSPKHPQNHGGMTYILVCDGWRTTALQGSKLPL